MSQGLEGPRVTDSSHHALPGLPRPVSAPSFRLAAPGALAVSKTLAIVASMIRLVAAAARTAVVLFLELAGSIPRVLRGPDRFIARKKAGIGNQASRGQVDLGGLDACVRDFQF
jgi:hypothetical protein